ncbi:MAG TPA: hypothetical protein VNK41_09845 [Vicinamibacterales bacterium]|nr:hypothetical protein [Vicinamibacterales bacterium]
MKILFFMRSTVYVRNFESTLRMLAERGHAVHVVADPHLPESNDLIARLCREHPRITHSHAPLVPFSAWSFFGREVRRAVDYLRYLEPDYAHAPKLRLRAERGAPDFIIAATKKPLFRTRAGRRALAWALRCVDRAVPRNPAVDAFIAGERPDLVLVTPLVEPGSPQAEYLRSARALGIPTGLCVYSWDNLTNKGLIHDPLDVVTVWNEVMKEEAVRLHKVPADRVVVTGAAAYDHWFHWQPRLDRETFCARVGLPSDRPYLLYLCSSRFVAPNEVEFIRRWIAAIRSRSTVLREAGVLVRPHPQNTDQWKQAAMDAANVVVWPRAGANPMDADSRSDYFDSIYHSAAVIGVNTSAQIESAIVGRGVYTLLAPEFRDTQEGTLHFHHLRRVNGGLLNVAESLDDHVAQLERAVCTGVEEDGRCRRFVEAFVRPHGIDVPATPRLVEALEAVAACGRVAPDRGAWWTPIARPILARAAARLAQTEKARKEKSIRQERIKRQRDADRLRRRAEAQAERQRVQAVRALERQREQLRRDAERRAREAFVERAYQHYCAVRAWAAGMRAAYGNGGALGDAERQAIAALAPLWNASPDCVAALRRYAEPLGGARPSDYEERDAVLAPRLKRMVGFLRKQLGSELFVPEPIELGGFGFVDQGALYNEDTARFFHVLVALQDAGVLQAFRGDRERRLVWEIGGGWGGFAYQFKRVCPNVTYVITGVPDLFLLSAVYLASLFPGGTCRFYDGAPGDALWRDWEGVDFVFAPEGALPSLQPPRLDLTLDVGALVRMEPRRLGAHVQRSFEMGSKFIYTLRDAAASDRTSGAASAVQAAIERWYWPHPVPPRRDPKLESAGQDPGLSHLVGWRRLRV